jgi:hypothetical protein
MTGHDHGHDALSTSSTLEQALAGDKAESR